MADRPHETLEREFLEFAPDAVIGVDETGEIRLVNSLKAVYTSFRLDWKTVKFHRYFTIGNGLTCLVKRALTGLTRPCLGFEQGHEKCVARWRLV